MIAFNRGGRRKKLVLAWGGILAATVVLSTGAYSHDSWEPVSLHVENNVLVPGGTAECLVQMTGGPESVTIYSDPPGVSYHGTLESATDTVDVQVSPYLDASEVTLYVQSDGERVVSTTVPVENTETPALTARPVADDAPSGVLR